MFKYIYTYILKHLFYFYYQLMNTEFYVPLTYILLKTNKPKLYKKKKFNAFLLQYLTNKNYLQPLEVQEVYGFLL